MYFSLLLLFRISLMHCASFETSRKRDGKFSCIIIRFLHACSALFFLSFSHPPSLTKIFVRFSRWIVMLWSHVYFRRLKRKRRMLNSLANGSSLKRDENLLFGPQEGQITTRRGTWHWYGRFIRAPADRSIQFVQDLTVGRRNISLNFFFSFHDSVLTAYV